MTKRPGSRPSGSATKARFSEFGEPICGHENAGCGQQPLNDALQPVLATIQALVLEEPRIDMLNDGPGDAETGTMGRTNLPYVGLDTVA
jgi:hypothetical protein